MGRSTAPTRAARDDAYVCWGVAKRGGGDGRRAPPRAPRHERWFRARFNRHDCGQAVTLKLPQRTTAPNEASRLNVAENMNGGDDDADGEESNGGSACSWGTVEDDGETEPEEEPRRAAAVTITERAEMERGPEEQAADQPHRAGRSAYNLRRARGPAGRGPFRRRISSEPTREEETTTVDDDA